MSVASFGERLLSIAGSFPAGTFTVARLSGREALGQRFGYGVVLLRHEQSRHVLVPADSQSAHKTVIDADTIPFHPEGTPVDRSNAAGIR